MIFRRRTKAPRLTDPADLDAVIEEGSESGRPVLIDFFQIGCAPCRAMDGIVDELADEYAGSAHVVKVDIRAMPPDVISRYAIQSTPTFVVLARSQKRPGKKSKRTRTGVTARWRSSGLVNKDVLAGVLETNGAVPAG